MCIIFVSLMKRIWTYHLIIYKNKAMFKSFSFPKKSIKPVKSKPTLDTNEQKLPILLYANTREEVVYKAAEAYGSQRSDVKKVVDKL